MSPQTGPDLVGAGYPISRPLLALLGGTNQSAQSNVGARTNLDYGLGNLKDVSTGSTAAGAGSVYSMAVPVLPGDVITKMALIVGSGSTIAAASVTNLWAALYTGTGSAPGTTGAQPSYIASGVPGSVSSGGAGSYAITLGQRLDFTFTSPQTITAAQAPYGYIYASYSLTTTGSAEYSLISMTCASAAQYPWYSTSPYSLFMTSNTAAGSSAPACVGTATRVTDPPVVILY